MKTLLLTVALALVIAPPSFGQSQPVRTTLSAAMVSPNNCQGATCVLTVSSATGIVASSASVGQVDCLVDQELMRLRSISSTTLTIQRNIQGFGSAHASGATIICGVVGTFNPATGTISSQVGSPAVGAGVTGATFVGSLPTGSCTRSNNVILPVFFVTAGPVGAGGSYGYSIDCDGGKWVAGTLPDSPGQPYLIGACTVPIGSVAYGSFGTSITASTTSEYTASIFVPYTMWVTGITQLNGSAVDTGSKKIVILKDSGGNLMSNSAVAGTAATGNDAFQAIAFTAARFVVGPAYYVVALQDDTADANGLRMVAASTFNNLVAGVTTSVFGTVAATTVPTTFTADQGPIACLY
jgi:hypothetical protein